MAKCTQDRKIYNIIFAGGNIPPMTAVLMAVKNGYETYVYTDRGRSFAGVELVDGFHNMGFDTEIVQSLDDEKAFNTAVSCIKNIKTKDDTSFFNIYTGESRGFKCAAIAANAGLGKDDFHIFMLEDGIDSYKKFAANYGQDAARQQICDFLVSILKRKWLCGKISDRIYSAVNSVSAGKGVLSNSAKKFLEKLSEKRVVNAQNYVKKTLNKILSATSNRYDNPDFSADYRWPFFLAEHENFTYCLQDEKKVENIVRASGNNALKQIFDTEGNGKNSLINMEYKNLSRRAAELDDRKKEQYLTVMFGGHGKEIYSLFGRKERCGEPAPQKKLVYVSSRLDTMFVKPVTNRVYGLGALSETAVFPTDYSQLPDKYKTIFLFNEENYGILSEAAAELDKIKDAPEEIIVKAKARVFNLYADYVFTAKLIYLLYGDRYDILVKNHPRTDIGCSFDWNDYYRIPYGDGKVVDYGRILDSALQKFHREDNVGRYIGVINGSLSTECFEYIDAQVSFCGQPSSVYNGLSDNADIPFIIVDSDISVAGEDSAHVSYSAVSGRYNSGKMKYTGEDGNRVDTVFYNTGNVLKACSRAAADRGEKALAEFYDSLFINWLEKKYPQAKDIDNQGFAVV